MARKRVWVGTKRVEGKYPHYKRKVFRSAETPTAETHSKEYDYVIGPFRTVRGAKWMTHYGWCGNPHCQTVSQCERLAKEEGERMDDLPKEVRKPI